MTGEQSGTSQPAIEVEVQRMLAFVVRALVDHPEDVKVEYLSEPEGTIFQVRANPADMGRLIGKNGQTARALRVVINASGVKNGRRFDVDIEGNEAGPQHRNRY